MRTPRGFTVVNSLAVILVIAALAGAVCFTPVYRTICPGVCIPLKTRANLAALESGCKRFKADNAGADNNYPPGGAANLLKYLTGKAMPLEARDGGFQRVKGGVVYGPYVDVDTIKTGTSPDGQVFLDSYGHQIGYWVWDGEKLLGGGNPDIKDPTAYASRNGRRMVDMFCASPGPDGTYSPNAWTPGTDDVVTFVPKD
ncbi:MAG: hypothetical protein NTV86_13935 [Planctomycetota bacterium]|nr:hypothetical protein [Planctomycetota bacterium]